MMRRGKRLCQVKARRPNGQLRRGGEFQGDSKLEGDGQLWPLDELRASGELEGDGQLRRGGELRCDGELEDGCELGACNGCPRGCERRAGTWRRSSDNVPVVRGVNFAPDSFEGAGSEFYFVPDSDMEVSSELHSLPVVDSEFLLDYLAEDLGSMQAVGAAVDSSGAKHDAVAKVDLSGGTEVATDDACADVATKDGMDDVLGSEYVVDEDAERQEQWVTDLQILWIPSYRSCVYRKIK